MMLRSLGLVTFLSCLHPLIEGSFKLIKVLAKKNSLALEKKLEAPNLLGSHRCLKNNSTAMAMDRDETYKSHAY